MEWVEEFYQRFTDGCDKENEYYDAQFTVSKPCEVENFIHDLLKNKTQKNNMDKTFAKGIFFDRPREGAPEFVKGRMSIKRDEAIEFLKTLEPSEAGFVNFDLLKSKDGSKLYFVLNDWKPEKKEESMSVLPDAPTENINPGDVPF